jgi:hypothetical protein
MRITLIYLSALFIVLISCNGGHSEKLENVGISQMVMREIENIKRQRPSPDVESIALEQQREIKEYKEDSIYLSERITTSDYQLALEILLETKKLLPKQFLDTAFVSPSHTVHYGLYHRLLDFKWDSVSNPKGLLTLDDIISMDRQSNGHYYTRCAAFKTFLKKYNQLNHTVPDTLDRISIMYPLFSVSKKIIVVGTEKHAINGGDSELMSYLFYRENGKWQYHVLDAVYRDGF